MRILCLGDLLGRAGRTAALEQIPQLKRDWQLDMVIVNGENAAGGFGINAEQCRELLAAGADAITLGDHAWDQRDLIPYVKSEPRVVRALNFPADTPGSGASLIPLPGGRKVMVLQVLGRVFMEPQNDPFTALDAYLDRYRLGRDAQAIVVDVHAEASSEKGALGYYLDGRVSLVFGTHTHIPTADTRILPQGTGFQTDLGMCGDYDSVIGFQPQTSIHRFLKKQPGQRFAPATGPATLCGVLLETDDRTGLAVSLKPVRLGGKLIPSDEIAAKA